MKVLTMTHEDALRLTINLGCEYCKSEVDVNDLDRGVDEKMDAILNKAAGVTSCYRTDNGDIIAWWE